MQDADVKEEASTKKGGLFWMLVPVVLLGVSSTAWLAMVSVAVNDPGFAVERDYYKKASRYDEVMAQRKDNERLGWKASVQSFEWLSDGTIHVEVALKDEAGSAIKGAQVNIEAFHNARAGQIQEVSLSEVKDGIYRVALDRPRLGLWELRLVAKTDQTFTQILRVELQAQAVGASPS